MAAANGGVLGAVVAVGAFVLVGSGMGVRVGVAVGNGVEVTVGVFVGVFVGGTGVAVKVAVGGTAVGTAVGGIAVAVGSAVGVGVLQPANAILNNTIQITPERTALVFIFPRYLIQISIEPAGPRVGSAARSIYWPNKSAFFNSSYARATAAAATSALRRISLNSSLPILPPPAAHTSLARNNLF